MKKPKNIKYCFACMNCYKMVYNKTKCPNCKTEHVWLLRGKLK
jgi:RNA polymerase subunit RPABC4/transcription elongation factor Spt4